MASWSEILDEACARIPGAFALPSLPEEATTEADGAAHWNRGLLGVAHGDARTWRKVAGFSFKEKVTFTPGQVCGGDLPALITYLAGAVARDGTADDVEPAWTDFLRAFPDLLDARAVDLDTLRWAGWIVLHQIGKQPVHHLGRRIVEYVALQAHPGVVGTDRIEARRGPDGLRQIDWFSDFGYEGAPPLASARGRGERTSTADVVRYLRGGRMVVFSPGIVDDPFRPGRIAGTPTIRTDGTYAWCDALAYFVEVHALALPAAFEAHVRAWALARS